jgi:hypothetical protein
MDHAAICHCLCAAAHPHAVGVCQPFEADTSRTYWTAMLGTTQVPLCQPCAAAQDTAGTCATCGRPDPDHCATCHAPGGHPQAFGRPAERPPDAAALASWPPPRTRRVVIPVRDTWT